MGHPPELDPAAGKLRQRAAGQRDDEAVREAAAAGLSIAGIQKITGLAATTIMRILNRPPSPPSSGTEPRLPPGSIRGRSHTVRQPSSALPVHHPVTRAAAPPGQRSSRQGRDHPTIMEVLAAFIREHSREQWPPAEDGAASPDRLTSPGVQAAVTVIGRRTSRHDSQLIALAGANLTRARLDGANLNCADLTSADLGGVISVPTGGSEGD